MHFGAGIKKSLTPLSLINHLSLSLLFHSAFRLHHATLFIISDEQTAEEAVKL